MSRGKLVLWFKEIGMKDTNLVGGKNGSLGEMYSNLTSRGVRVPNGFATTTTAYWQFLRQSGIEKQLQQLVKSIGKDKSKITGIAPQIRRLILSAKLPAEFEAAIAAGYNQLAKEYGPNPDVAVRSSANAEDMPTASFAGQQETYLNIRGEKALINACKRCIASLFTDRAISYRIDGKIDSSKVALSVGVQKMVRSDLASSGVMFTLDTETGFKDVIFINAAYGLGEFVVQGVVNPDEYYAFKPKLGSHMPVIKKNVGEKREKLVYGIWPSPTVKVSVPEKDRKSYVLNDREIIELARFGKIIETCAVYDDSGSAYRIDKGSPCRIAHYENISAFGSVHESLPHIAIYDQFSAFHNLPELILGIAMHIYFHSINS